MRWLTKNISKRSLSKHRASVVALLVANVVPLLGVLLFDWSTFEIVALYWFENVVLGVINILKMLTCSPDSEQIDLPRLLLEKVDAKTRRAIEEAGSLETTRWIKLSTKLFFTTFFTIHYGIFCLVHGVFVVVLLGGGGLGGMQNINPSLNLVIAALALTGSHLFSFFVNYLGRGEYQRTILPVLMFQPYGRVFVLHIAIVLGAFAVIVLGSPVLLLILMIVGKTLLDLNLHLREHQTDAYSSEEETLLKTI